MSEPILDVVDRQEIFHGNYPFSDSWILKLYSIQVDARPVATVDLIVDLVKTKTESISARMSDEFDYGRFGCAVYHTGRRGVCLSITHFGAWGRTFEVFSSTWYSYGHSNESFELLDDLQPAMCWFEVPRIFAEITQVCDLARLHALDGVRTAYLSTSA
jgi:hypothetical protein